MNTYKSWHDGSLLDRMGYLQVLHRLLATFHCQRVHFNSVIDKCTFINVNSFNNHSVLVFCINCLTLPLQYPRKWTRLEFHAFILLS